MKRYYFFIVLVLGIMFYSPTFASTFYDTRNTTTSDIVIAVAGEAGIYNPLGIKYSSLTPQWLGSIEVHVVNTTEDFIAYLWKDEVGGNGTFLGQTNRTSSTWSGTSTIAYFDEIKWLEPNTDYWIVVWPFGTIQIPCSTEGGLLVKTFSSSTAYLPTPPVPFGTDDTCSGSFMGRLMSDLDTTATSTYEGYHVSIGNLTNGLNYYKPKFLTTYVNTPLPRQNSLREIVYHTTSTIQNAFETLYIPITDLVSPTATITSVMDFDVSTSTWILTRVDLYDVLENVIRASTSVYWHYETNATTTYTNKLKQLFDRIELEMEGCTASSTTWWSYIYWNHSVDYISCQTNNLLRKLYNTGIIPHESLLDEFNDSWQSLKHVFPFNLTFGLADTINAEITSASTTKTLVLPLYPTSTSISLTSTTVSNVIGVDNYNQIRNFETAIIWGLIGLAMLFIII